MVLFSDESFILLTLYEFEAKVQLGTDSDLSECLDAAEASPHTDSSTFETLAGNQFADTFYMYNFLLNIKRKRLWSPIR